MVALTSGILLGGGAVLWAAGEKTAQKKPTAAIHIESSSATYKEVVPGVSKAALWGNETKGAYGTFTRFKPGQRNDLHTHTNDVRIVVLSGAYVYEPEGGEAIRVAQGGYLMVPAGTRHVSSGDPSEGALFYEESPGKFDMVPVDKKQ
jgi:quercetin dioxygenase-like cupin family protein